MMDDFVAMLIGIIWAFLGLFIGQRMAPKNKTAREMQEFYESSMARLKKEIQRLNGTVSVFRRGNIPTGVDPDSKPEAVIDSVLSALPPNFRMMLAPFKNQIMEYAKTNPEAIQTVIEVIKAKSGQGQEQDAVANGAV